MNDIRKIRETSPLVYNIMNEVASNFSANGLIAIGASPSVSNMPQEAEENARSANAVILNLGTLSEDRAKAMLLAGKAANEAGVPVILDPIAVGATSFRTDVIYNILSNVKLAAICANAGEIAVLGDVLDKTSSPDSALEENDPAVAKKVANKYNTHVISTGKTDVITDGTRVTLCNNGHHMMQNITASGCLLSAIVGAFASISEEDLYPALIKATAGYGIAAERAMKHAKGPGTFIPAFLDQLYFLDDDMIQTDQQLEVL